MIFDTLLAAIAPHECLGCGQEGSLLCAACTSTLRRLPARCYRCQRITEGYKTCKACRAHSELFAVVPFASYEGLAKDLVWRLKFNSTQAAARKMAELMGASLPAGQALVVVPVPTASSRARKRGYDQALLLAKAVAAYRKLSYAPCLRRLGQAEQLGAGRERRLVQLQDAYRVVGAKRLQGQHVILVDDVLTTGATLEAAARTIRAAGAGRVSALVFAQA